MNDGSDMGNETITLEIKEIESAEDVSLIEKKLRSLPGISSFEVDLDSKQVELIFDPSKLMIQDVMRSISETGMNCSLAKEHRPRSNWWRDRQQLALYGSGLVTLTSFILMFLGAEELVTNALFGVAVLIGVFYPARKALIALSNLVFTIHLLMLIGAGGAVILGMWYEAAILIFVYSLGDVLESYAVDKARGAIRSLTELVPKKAMVRKNGNELIMSTEEIDIGDIVIVRPGERIPVDGEVFQGVSFVDQAAVTGEPLPVEKKLGDDIYAGTINQNGSLEIKVNRRASETMLSKIICSVEEAQASRTSYQP